MRATTARGIAWFVVTVLVVAAVVLLMPMPASSHPHVRRRPSSLAGVGLQSRPAEVERLTDVIPAGTAPLVPDQQPLLLNRFSRRLNRNVAERLVETQEPQASVAPEATVQPPQVPEDTTTPSPPRIA